MAAKAQMTGVQIALWPDKLPTDPAMVAAMYDGKADTSETFARRLSALLLPSFTHSHRQAMIMDRYGEDTMADGWVATFNAMRPEFEQFVEAWQDRARQTSAQRPLRVLDAGCGDGLLPEYVSMPVGTELHGNDLSPKLVAAVFPPTHPPTHTPAQALPARIDQ